MGGSFSFRRTWVNYIPAVTGSRAIELITVQKIVTGDGLEEDERANHKYKRFMGRYMGKLKRTRGHWRTV
ncbi:hypothetical protein [Brevibacillus sedimenti]|uniref:hypothetical protein n=1 Tax=Brevibacillus sedimenti TaxID=2613334 RepID=UPI001E3A770A|nr:hypothetical protein [Anoxybacillus sediminis]UFJ62771.1 hypothetical protein IRT44_08515 [Anoxybacillus sediminis]